MLNITSGRVARPQKLVIYGVEGIGKTSLAAQTPDPLFIDTEGGTAHLNVRRLQKPQTWSELIAIVKKVDDEQERISLFAALSDHKRLLDKVVTMGEDKAATAIMHLQRAAAQLGEEVLKDARSDAETMTAEDLRRSMRKLVNEIEAADGEGETSWQP